MGWQRGKEFAGDSRAPAEARNFTTTALLARLGPAAVELVHDAALVVSELVTNAVRAACRTVQVELAVESADARGLVRIEVADDAEGWPAVHQPATADVSGRGLLLVTALVHQWGVEPEVPAGKRIWVTLPLPPSEQRVD